MSKGKKTASICHDQKLRHPKVQMSSARSKVHILYATATGTAEDVAQGLAEQLVASGAEVKSCMIFDEYPIAQLPFDAAQNDLFVFIIATCGDGEVPITMRKFWGFIRRSDLPESILADLKFAVFGLGDRAYVKFNAAARKLCTRLVDLGASLLIALGLGDDSAEGGYDGALLPWFADLLPIVSPHYLPSNMNVDMGYVREPRLSLNILPHASEKSPSVEIWEENKWRPRQARKSTRSANSALSDTTVLSNSLLTNSEYLEDDKEVRQIQLDISKVSKENELLTYQPGDIVHVLARNYVKDVDEFFELTRFDPCTVIDVKPRISFRRFGEYNLNINTPCTLREFVSAQLDLSSTPRRRFFERLAPFASNDLEREKLLEFSSAEGSSLLSQYAYREKHSLLNAIRDFPSARPPLEHLIDMIPVLKSRAFSIASSMKAHGQTIEICASIVRFKTPLRVSRIGVCSSFFLGLKIGDCVPVFLERGSSLRFAGEKPSILIGPGTGIAPMRSFLSSSEANTKPRLLFVGFRSSKGDFLYSDDWNRYLESGQLSRLITALSREPDSTKNYVQDKMYRNAEEIWDLISRQGCRVYVAGAAGAMPKDVRQALVSIVSQYGSMDEEDSDMYVRRLEGEGRLQMECW